MKIRTTYASQTLEDILDLERPYTGELGSLEETDAYARHALRLAESLLEVLVRRRIITPADLQEVCLGHEITNPDFPRWEEDTTNE